MRDITVTTASIWAVTAWLRRLWARVRPYLRPIAIVVAVASNALTASGYVLAAAGVATVPAEAVTAIALVVGVVAFLFVVYDYERALNAKMAPDRLASAVNVLRRELRGLADDAFKPPSEVPHAQWQERCSQLLAGTRQLISTQRNKYETRFIDTTERLLARRQASIGKNEASMQMLRGIEAILGEIADEIRYD
jgi:hypothetical protein